MEKHIETVFLTLRDKWDDSSHLEILINAFVRCCNNCILLLN